MSKQSKKIGFMELFISIGGIIATLIGLAISFLFFHYLLKGTDIQKWSNLIGLGFFLVYEATWIFVALDKINNKG